MKQKHYEAIAQAIKENLVKPATEIRELIYINRFVVALCNILKAENPKFNADKFKEAIK